MHTHAKIAPALWATLLLAISTAACHAQAALLMEEPYGFFGTVNPTGHSAIYIARVCAETQIKLRRCGPGETGVVISRYQGIDGYDWIAMPLIPYLYSVESADKVPAHVDRHSVTAMRNRYHEAHLMSLGEDLDEGNLVRGGWTQLVGAAYQRRIYAFRFATTPEQDDAVIDKLNAAENQSHFELLYNNCADFARVVLNTYFPRTFRRSVFPDIGITTPKQNAHKLVHYARKHPELQLEVFEIPMVPGYQHLRRSNNGVAEAFLTTGYAIPLALVNPWLAGGIALDYLAEGQFHALPKHPEVLTPGNLLALTHTAGEPENAASAETQAFSAIAARQSAAQNSGLSEIKAAHE